MVRIDPGRLDAVIFDVDGVVTDTAGLHFAAWKAVFDEELRRRTRRGDAAFEEFTHEDYLAHVDGKPRYDGVRDFLAARGIELPEGGPGDPPDRSTVCSLGNRKNERFLERVETGAVDVYPSTVALLDQLAAASLVAAAISASRNAREVLAAAGVLDRFPVVVDGIVADELGLAGKPDPAVFLEAARRLDVAPERTVVVEDARSGVEAGRRGGFGLVVGVDRSDQRDALLTHGADVVVEDLREVVVGDALRNTPESRQARA